MAWRVAGGAAVLLLADSSAYFGLNPSGTRLWERLAESPATADQLATWAHAAFFGATGDLAAEISSFLNLLTEQQLLLCEEGKAADLSAGSKVAAGDVTPWERPTLERFGELERLILSGE